MSEIIKFYVREEPYGFLSNFWRHPQTICGRIYPTNEHFYQSQKALDYDISEWIRCAPNATLAMNAGRSLPPKKLRFSNLGWVERKTGIMLDGLRAKFSDPELALLLDWTGDAILIEDSPTDMYWGGSLPGSANMLGKLLMEVREELRTGV